jgi:hypothetical protein
VTTRILHALPRSCVRNGTFIRVILVDPPGLPERARIDQVDIQLHRILVLIAPNLESLDAQTCSLQRAAAIEGIALVSADGHHHEILNRIAAANRGNQ